MTQPVLVVGAGLAGLALARTLLARQIPFRVLEAAPQLKKYSYGVTLLPWAYEPLASKLNLGTVGEFKRASATDSTIGGAGFINAKYTDAYTGRPILSENATSQKPKLAFRCSRTGLTDLLAHGLDIEYHKKLESVETSSKGVCLHFEDGSTAEGSLAVGADGVHSAVRRSILPHVAPEVIPALAVNGGMRLSQPEFDAALGRHMGKSQVMVGVGHQVAVTITVSNHTADGAQISWTFTWQPEDASYQTDRQCIDDARKIPQQFFDRLHSLGPLAEPFSTILSPDTAHETAKYNWLMRSVHVPVSELMNLASKRTALIGDAAHAMPIVAGEGANHALLDGIQLGEAIAAHKSPREAVQQFYQQQHVRWENGVEKSIKQFSSLHKPIEQWRG